MQTSIRRRRRLHSALGHTGPVTVPESATASPRTAVPVRERFGLEVLAVLGVSLGMSAIYAVLSLVRTQLTTPGGIANARVVVVGQAPSQHPWLDLASALADVLHGVLPAFLALVLLARVPGGRGFGIGFGIPSGRDVAQGLGFCALIGIPGLALVWAARHVGINATLDVVSFPDLWYRVPVLLLDAAQNGLLEEVVVVGYLLTRLRQMRWSDSRALAAESVLRGSYHLYQGVGAFFGNAVMGAIFGWWFQRTRRVMPLVIAHFLIDAISFVGYIYLHDRISWI